MPNKQYLDFAGLKHYHEKAKREVTGNGISQSQDFLIGDLKVTKNQNQTDDWLYCNASLFKKSEYPGLIDYAPWTAKPVVRTLPVSSSISSNSSTNSIVKHLNGLWVNAIKYLDKTQTRSMIVIRWTDVENPGLDTVWNENIVFDNEATTVNILNMVYFKGEYCIAGTIYGQGTGVIIHGSDLESDFDCHVCFSSGKRFYYCDTDGHKLVCMGTDESSTENPRPAYFWSMDYIGGPITETPVGNINVFAGNTIYCEPYWLTNFGRTQQQAALCYSGVDSWNWDVVPISIPNEYMSYAAGWWKVRNVRYQSNTKKYYAYVTMYDNTSSGVYATIGVTEDLLSGNWEWSLPFKISYDPDGWAGYSDGYFVIERHNVSGSQTTQLWYAKTLTDDFEVLNLTNQYGTESNQTVLSYAQKNETIVGVVPIGKNTSYYVYQFFVPSAAGVSYGRLPSISDTKGHVFIKGR